MTRSLLAVTVVFGLLGLFAWLVRRGTLRLYGGRGARQPIAIETAVPLGERRSLAIVTVEGRRLLVGLTPGQICLVTELQSESAFTKALEHQLDVAQSSSSALQERRLAAGRGPS